MNPRRYKSPIPANAREVVDKSYQDGAKEQSSFFLGKNLVGRRIWWDDGRTAYLEYGIKDGEKHGYELTFYQDGLLSSAEPYRNGKMHGKAAQFARDGSTLICYVMKNGVGLDLWCDEDGNLSEELYWPRENELGFKRLWNEGNTSVRLEESWLADFGWHGILRKWNGNGRLCRGFPQFYVRGQRLTKRRYLLLWKSDKAIPPYLPEHDQPSRMLPQEYLVQRNK